MNKINKLGFLSLLGLIGMVYKEDRGAKMWD